MFREHNDVFPRPSIDEGPPARLRRRGHKPDRSTDMILNPCRCFEPESERTHIQDSLWRCETHKPRKIICLYDGSQLFFLFPGVMGSSLCLKCTTHGIAGRTVLPCRFSRRSHYCNTVAYCAFGCDRVTNTLLCPYFFAICNEVHTMRLSVCTRYCKALSCCNFRVLLVSVSRSTP